MIDLFYYLAPAIENIGVIERAMSIYKLKSENLMNVGPKELETTYQDPFVPHTRTLLTCAYGLEILRKPANYLKTICLCNMSHQIEKLPLNLFVGVLSFNHIGP